MTDHKSKLESLATLVIKEGASDLHLSEGRSPVLRVSGFLTELSESPTSKEEMKGFLSELLPRHALAEFETKKEADFAWSFKDEARFRGNAFVQQNGISVALRLIPKTIRSVADLNLPVQLQDFARKTQGFFLVVGPVGQGKTTTLAALIELINSERAEHIITIEDPIEYIFEPKKSIIDQREVKVNTGSFPSALQAMFREDVDVVMVGEMRDTETISTAVTAAETGHLVFSTLHTNDAAQTIDRVIDSFPASQQDQIRLQLSSSLLGIFSQRLIPRISGGLIPAYELLINNSAVSNLIRERRTHEINTVIETGMEQGMIDLNRSLAELVRKGEITVENAHLYSSDSKILDRYL
ncbi:MAG: PilT/PilU family type 4a pilus ATPase [Patescibacteria group bacterium]